MTYEIVWSRAARRAVQEELPESVAAACIEFVLGPLAGNPYRVSRPLVGPLAGFRSARRGEFRVIFEVQEHVVRVRIVSIRHRRDAYRS